MGVGLATSIYGLPAWGLITLSLWELVWKGIALWKTARKDQTYWYVAILILNTVGILPIVYLLFFQKKRNAVKRSVRKSAKKSVRKSAKKSVKSKKSAKKRR